METGTDNRDFNIFTVGIVVGIVFIFIFITVWPGTVVNEENLCYNLANRGYNTVYTEQTDECRLLNEQNELVPFIVQEK